MELELLDEKPVLLHGEITEKILGAAIAVHSALGPGLLESAYEACLAYEFHKRGIQFQRQVELPVIYDSQRVDCGFRIDFIVEAEVILELKSVERVAPLHEAQLNTYLRLSRKRVGLLINFNSVRIRDAIYRRVL